LNSLPSGRFIEYIICLPMALGKVRIEEDVWLDARRVLAADCQQRFSDSVTMVYLIGEYTAESFSALVD
jgi:hypothetical protein